MSHICDDFSGDSFNMRTRTLEKAEDSTLGGVCAWQREIIDVGEIAVVSAHRICDSHATNSSHPRRNRLPGPTQSSSTRSKALALHASWSLLAVLNTCGWLAVFGLLFGVSLCSRRIPMDAFMSTASRNGRAHGGGNDPGYSLPAPRFSLDCTGSLFPVKELQRI